MLSDTELIRKLEFFEPLDQKIIKNIAAMCIVREFAIGDAIVRQGESGLGLYFITAGRAKVEIDREGVKYNVAELKDGDFLGEFSIIDDKTRSASVICLEDTRCLLLTRDTFSKLLQKYPQIAAQMLRILVTRIRSTNDKLLQPSPTLAAVAASAPAPGGPAAPAPEAAESNGRRATSSLMAATEQIAAIIPKPEDMARFYTSTKGKTQEFLTGMFGAILGIKPFLRFSAAIVGCPVSVAAQQQGPDVIEATIGEVKLVIFPADQDQTIRITGLDDGHVLANILGATPRDPNSVEMVQLAGPIHLGEQVELHFAPSGNFRLKARECAYPTIIASPKNWLISRAEISSSPVQRMNLYIE